jgi:hypothetical protein
MVVAIFEFSRRQLAAQIALKIELYGVMQQIAGNGAGADEDSGATHRVVLRCEGQVLLAKGNVVYHSGAKE